MAKKTAKIYEEEEEEKIQTALNNTYDARGEDDEPLSINAELEEEEQSKSDEIELLLMKQAEEEEENNSGKLIPTPQAKRDPKKDLEPIEGEDLGVRENDFLLSRKVTPQDLEAHMKINEEELLGSNVTKTKDFLDIFQRGASSKKTPKIDTAFNVENNQEIQKELAAKQLLRNFHSKNNKEKGNTLLVFQDMELSEELLAEIKADGKAYQNEALILKLRELLSE